MLFKIVIYQTICWQSVKGGVTQWPLLIVKVTNLLRKTDFLWVTTLQIETWFWFINTLLFSFHLIAKAKTHILKSPILKLKHNHCFMLHAAFPLSRVVQCRYWMKMYPNSLIFLSLLSAHHKAQFPHVFSYLDPPSPDPILESWELQSSCSLPLTPIARTWLPHQPSCHDISWWRKCFSRLETGSPTDPIWWLHFWETEDLKVTEGFLQDKETFNLVSITLVLLHFALLVVQQTCTNLSPGQMLYLTQSWFNP